MTKSEKFSGVCMNAAAQSMGKNRPEGYGRLEDAHGPSHTWLPSTCQKRAHTVGLYPKFQMLTCGTWRGILAAFLT